MTQKSMTDIYPLLNSVHSLVFNNFKYRTDMSQYGDIEKWVMPNEYYSGREKVVGDCEDFALACRKLLRDRGVDSRLVFCQTETGEGHLVLEVDGWILDNRESKVVPRETLEYNWISISGYRPGDPWHTIKE